jgi:Tol biopolymer transport system component
MKTNIQKILGGVTLILMSCTSCMVEPKRVISPVYTDTVPTSTEVPIGLTVSVTSTPENRLFSTVAQLPVGQYLLLSSGNVDTSGFNLTIISPNGYEQEVFVTNSTLDITANGRYLVDWGESEMLDLISGENLSIPRYVQRCQNPVLSPDARNILGDCMLGDVTLDIFLLSSIEPERLTFCDAHRDFCSTPDWSSDGNWITYFQSPSGAYQGHQTGMFVVSTGCLSNPTSCEGAAYGPYNISDYSWSPDNRYLATLGWDGNSMAIYSFDAGNLYFDHEISGEFELYPISWSPDGQWIAYTFSNSIYLVSPDGLQSQLLFSAGDDVEIIGWVNIP